MVSPNNETDFTEEELATGYAADVWGRMWPIEAFPGPLQTWPWRFSEPT